MKIDLEVDALLEKIFSAHSLKAAYFSSPLNKKSELKKVIVRSLFMKGKMLYQISLQTKTKIFHKNYTENECKNQVCESFLKEFKQILLKTENTDYQILQSAKGGSTILSQSATSQSNQLHNREKKRIFSEGTPVPFLIELGIQRKDGAIIAKMRDKYVQINRYLEIVEGLLPYLPEKKVEIVDLGCGKAYLTFALYYYFHFLKGFAVNITGVDLKEDLIQFCNEIAKKVGFSGLKFEVGNLHTYSLRKDVDVVVALHACDTATDAVLCSAIKSDVKIVLSAPCCQHELLQQLQCPILHPLLKHGILKERFSALATDAARAQLLESFGYDTTVMEFIDYSHTPKNLLIRAILNPKKKFNLHAYEQYKGFKDFLSIFPALERKLEDFFPKN